MSSTTHSNQDQVAVAIAAILGGTALAGLMSIFDAMDWADDEITKATQRHPDHADELREAFQILAPNVDLGEGVTTEFVYRSHAAELLERVASGADTRAATNAELVIVCKEISRRVPLHGAAAGLYLRLWAQAFPTHPLSEDHDSERSHYEHLFGSQMDELEAELRRKVANPDRRLGKDG